MTEHVTWYYGIRHEGAASFACAAYGKLTGRPAACLSIAGPGATNLLTGLWDALHNPNFARFAEDCGGLGRRVTKKEELDDALARALAHPGFSLVEVMADPELI